MWATPENLVNCAFYGQVIIKKGYNRIKKVWAALPEGETMSPIKVISALSGVETEEGNGKDGNAKTTRPATVKKLKS